MARRVGQSHTSSVGEFARCPLDKKSIASEKRLLSDETRPSSQLMINLVSCLFALGTLQLPRYGVRVEGAPLHLAHPAAAGKIPVRDDGRTVVFVWNNRFNPAEPRRGGSICDSLIVF